MFKAIRNWFLRKFIMCKCSTPSYEVKNKVLYCQDCDKPTEWHLPIY